MNTNPVATEPNPARDRPTLRRALGRFDAAMIVIGGIIGAGIFINPYIVAQRLDSPALVLAAWAAGGAIAIAGALTFAELGSLFPRAGGQYVYLRDAFHPLAGFLYGWALLLMIEGGAIAAVAIVFAQYTLAFLGREGGSLPLAMAAIVVLAVVNYFGVKPGSRLLNVFVVLKVAALALLIAAGLLVPVEPAASVAAAAPSSTFLPIAFGSALIAIMFSYGGWQSLNYVAEEMERPQRDLPVAMITGIMVVVAVYLLVNVVYLKALGHGGLAATQTPASDTAGALLGSFGDRAVALAIAISTFGFLDLRFLAPTRVYYAMAADGVFFPAVAKLHPKHQSPHVAIAIQTAWALGLVLTGTYAQLVDYVVFADWIFFGLAGAAVFVFRRRIPLADRPAGTFRTPGYPLVPALFVGAAAVVLISVLWSSPGRSGIGAILLATGVPAYLYWRRGWR